MGEIERRKFTAEEGVSADEPLLVPVTYVVSLFQDHLTLLNGKCGLFRQRRSEF